MKAFAWALVICAFSAHAQKTPQIGVLIWDSNTFADAFRAGLKQNGYVEGKSIVVELRSAERDRRAAAAHAADFVRRKVDIIVTQGTQSVEAAKQATTLIPIVMGGVADPAGVGLVASLAHAGSNITGMSLNVPGVAGKRLELLSEAFPGLHRVTFLGSTDSPNATAILRETRRAAQRLKIQLQETLITGPEDLDRAFAAIAKARSQALIMQGILTRHRKQIISRAARLHLPTISEYPVFPESGGLMSYGPDQDEVYGRAAVYVDRILKGARPRDLPIEEPSRYYLVINGKTASALKLKISKAVLARADKVIE